MNHLYRFSWDFGRSGRLEGLFVATEKKVSRAIGSVVYFGEVLGKHSEVRGTIQEGDIQKLDASSESVEEIRTYLGDTWSGFNPLKYRMLTCDRCEETLRADEWTCQFRADWNQTLCDECVEELEREV